MANKIFGPHKRRTRQHVIADLAVHHVQGFILEEGHTSEEFRRDYGYDLLMRTYDKDGFLEPEGVYFQIKATEHLKEVGRACVYDLDIRDYNLWMTEQTLVVLVLFDAIRRRAYWLAVKRHFVENEDRRPAKGAKWVRVRIPKRQRMNRQAIADLRVLNKTLSDF